MVLSDIGLPMNKTNFVGYLLSEVNLKRKNLES